MDYTVDWNHALPLLNFESVTLITRNLGKTIFTAKQVIGNPKSLGVADYLYAFCKDIYSVEVCNHESGKRRWLTGMEGRKRKKISIVSLRLFTKGEEIKVYDELN